MPINAKQFINKRPALVGSTVLIIGALAIFGSMRMSCSQTPSEAINQAYFSDDDGKTYFPDDLSKIYSFDHGGKPACRAYVYRCASGAPYVGSLARNPGGKPNATTAPISTADAAKAGARAMALTMAVEVKRPGDSNWVLRDSPAGRAIEDVTCPDGQRPIAVLPGGQ